MLESAIGSVKSDVSQVYSLMTSMAAVWNDRVSSAVDESLLRTVVSRCNEYSSEMDSQLMMIKAIRGELESLVLESY